MNIDRHVPGLDDLGEIDAADTVRCARALLRRPLLYAGGPDGDLLPMLYRRREALQEMFAALLGYRLVVQRRFARLYKPGLGQDATRGATTLSPRGYCYLALTLAALTGSGRQMLLSRLAEDVRSAAVEAGVTVGDGPADRRALASALRHLVSLGVIGETEGSVAPPVGDPAAEALITVDTDVLGRVVSGPVAEASDPAELLRLAERAAGTEHAVRRKLVESPVVHYGDLPAEQARWLRGNQARESRLLERCFGLVTESRLEGIAVSDPQDHLTDVVFPGPGTVARIAVLALPELLERGAARDGDHRRPVTGQDIAEVCGGLVESYPAAWSRQATDDPEELVHAVIELLRRLGVLAREDGDRQRWLLSPSAHRWVPQPDAGPATGTRPRPATPAPTPEPSLFDDWEGEDLP